ncbi:BQ5605_C020g09095 [Microbotryum silenes-dioicae]|uniref:Carboxypeptidase n=1 Tax=Microbotryum silenes-dioicae TaxID=796604 RepID=A0A2X0PJH8_9BASI|nr:BQ5605_C020g09095 [Microbotryum silenes-dioicae]
MLQWADFARSVGLLRLTGCRGLPEPTRASLGQRESFAKWSNFARLRSLFFVPIPLSDITPFEMLVLSALAALLPVVVALPANQLPFTTPAPVASAFLTTPENPQNDFEVLYSADHPEHRVRARTPKGLCDPDVEQKSGYLDTANGRHFYFWQFDSRNDPKNDPVVMWLNGGPGCSSFTGLLMELGPCGIRAPEHVPCRNPWSWNNNASLIFLDQPVGVGYSYAEKGDKGTWTTEAAAEDVFAFLTIFFENYAEKFGGRPFFIAGESYAGRYIPVFADYIVTQNLKNELNGKPKINLQGVLIGNGFTNPKMQYGAYFPTGCTNSTGYGPYVDAKDCASMAAALPRCQALIQKCYDDPTDAAVCLSANQYCEATQTERYYETGRNPYDMEKFGGYAEEPDVAKWLNRADIRHQLGVDNEVSGGVKRFIGCSDPVGFRFSTTGDQSKATYPHVTHMVENGVRTLIYAGKRDWI